MGRMKTKHPRFPYQGKLIDLMGMHGMKEYELAEELDISLKSLSHKINGHERFKWVEIVTICKVLNIENPLDVFDAQEIDISKQEENKPAQYPVQSKLIEKMKEHGLRQHDVAAELYITRAKISRKLNGIEVFTLEEVGKICKMLAIENPFDVFEVSYE